MLLHRATRRGTIEAACCNIRAIARDLAQRFAGGGASSWLLAIRVRVVGVVCIGALQVLDVDDTNIREIRMRASRIAFYECGECRKGVGPSCPCLPKKKEQKLFVGNQGRTMTRQQQLFSHLGSWNQGLRLRTAVRSAPYGLRDGVDHLRAGCANDFRSILRTHPSGLLDTDWRNWSKR